jgi:dihydrofolate synthase/folylpolyglutamate synthase
MRTKDEWFRHIDNVHQQRIQLGLDRVGVVAERLSVTQFSCPVITVAGTNGKGSCVKTLETIYATAGYKVGLYTSPHLLDFNERIRIDNKMITDEALLHAFAIVEAARLDTILSFFEFITLAALYLFQQAGCDVLVLEIGLGGRLDAVNIVENDIAILTSVAFDHMDYLGDTLELIGYEKASIARAGKPFICAEEHPPLSVARTVSQKKGLFYKIFRDFSIEVDHYAVSRLKKENVGAAVFAINLLQPRLPVLKRHIIEGIQATDWPGRFEVLAEPFPCVLDVAHNPHASAWLAKQYADLPFMSTVAIVGMLKDKAQIETLQPLLSSVQTWFVCDISAGETERGSDGMAMMHFLKSVGANCYHFISVEAAMMQVHCQRPSERALIFGSFYTVSRAKKWVGSNLWKKEQNNV